MFISMYICEEWRDVWNVFSTCLSRDNVGSRSLSCVTTFVLQSNEVVFLVDLFVRLEITRSSSFFFFLVLIYNAGLQLRGLHLEIFYIDGYSIDIQTDESCRRMRNSESEFLKRAG